MECHNGLLNIAQLVQQKVEQNHWGKPVLSFKQIFEFSNKSGLTGFGGGDFSKKIDLRGKPHVAIGGVHHMFNKSCGKMCEPIH